MTVFKLQMQLLCQLCHSHCHCPQQEQQQWSSTPISLPLQGTAQKVYLNTKTHIYLKLK